ncbi:GrpB family protein [Legionella sp. CNM-1927-20]|uniref:GrpB family protein n=1 Tax=Legionella sp. CNM-1927-20 TaxID=3422221 RepID=UPI00403A8C08
MPLDEPITLSEYDVKWPKFFLKEKLQLESVFANQVTIEHFGSTAVPGMMAKPIIDVLIGIKNSNAIESFIAPLQQLGYEYLGEAGVEGRLYFRKRGKINFNLAVVLLYGEHWQNNLAIRDYLRTHPLKVNEYNDLKKKIILRGKTMFLAYSQEKEQFIRDLLTLAHLPK